MSQDEGTIFGLGFISLFLSLVLLTAGPFVVESMVAINQSVTSPVWYKAIGQFLVSLVTNTLKGILMGVGKAFDIVLNWSSLVDQMQIGKILYATAVLFLTVAVIFTLASYIYNSIVSDGGFVVPLMISVLLVMLVIAPLSMVLIGVHDNATISVDLWFNVSSINDTLDNITIQNYPLINLVGSNANQS